MKQGCSGVPVGDCRRDATCLCGLCDGHYCDGCIGPHHEEHGEESKRRPRPLPEPSLEEGGAPHSPHSDRAETRRPKIVCLCGSTRYPEAWKAAHREESLAGRIVLSVGVMIQAGDSPIRHDGPEKRALDELHLRKIDLADEVLVLNVGGYIGESTAREIVYAESRGKPIRYLEDAP